MSKKQLGILSIFIFSLGYYVGMTNSSNHTVYVNKMKAKEVLRCQEEVKELKTQCHMADLNSGVNRDENKEAQNLQAGEPDTKSSRRANEIAFESDKKEFLKQVEIKNLFEELKSAKVVGEDQLKVLNGIFTGQVEFDETDRPNWDMELRLNGQVSNEEPRGDKLISLFKNGKLFSRTTGKGRIKGVMSMGSDPNTFLIEVNGDEGYVQMYYLPRMDEFAGIYYQKVGIGEFEREGTVTLKRSYSNASF